MFAKSRVVGIRVMENGHTNKQTWCLPQDKYVNIQYEMLDCGDLYRLQPPVLHTP